MEQCSASGGNVAVCLCASYGTNWNGNAGAYSGENFVQEKHMSPFAIPYLLKIRSGCEGGGKGALIQENKSATISTLNDQYLFQPVYSIENHPADSRVNIDESGKVQTLTSRMGTGGGNVPMIMEPYCLQGSMIGRADKNGPQGDRLSEGVSFTLNTIDRHAVAYLARGKNAVGTLMANAGQKLWLGNQEAFTGDYHIIEEYEDTSIQYIVRRLTPTECARLQGFADWWAHIDQKETLTDKEYRFWLEVRNTHAAINGREEKEYTKAQILTWYNKLYTDSAEYKMWGNGIALPPALYCMQGITEVLSRGMAATEEVEVTDLSDAPQEIKEEIMKNAETLEKRTAEENQAIETPSETKETLETKETEVKAQPAEKTAVKETPLSGSSAVAQLRQLADERKALAELFPEQDRFSKDVRAIECAVNMLVAIGL